MSGLYGRLTRSDVYGYVGFSCAGRFLESSPPVFKAFSTKWFARETSLSAGSQRRAASFRRSRLCMPAKRNGQAMKLATKFDRFLEIVGGSTLRHLEYVGGLTIQLRQATGSLRRSLPFIGNRNRWRSAIQQMTAIGIDAIPMVAVM